MSISTCHSQAGLLRGYLILIAVFGLAIGLRSLAIYDWGGVIGGIATETHAPAQIEDSP